MKGTPSMGKRSGKKTHIYCRRCGNHTYHKRKKICSSCGFGRGPKIRKYAWQTKIKR
ncbi:50S ribosomal protein L37e [Candidatus Woesearchaeota archaeon]|nr:50S ribosomal protein L37e [Candidatus Woesearchaeota archaeon]